jgi:hypothetical protein
MGDRALFDAGRHVGALNKIGTHWRYGPGDSTASLRNRTLIVGVRPATRAYVKIQPNGRLMPASTAAPVRATTLAERLSGDEGKHKTREDQVLAANIASRTASSSFVHRGSASNPMARLISVCASCRPWA